MTDATTLLSIGELSRRTGLPVRTIRRVLEREVSVPEVAAAHERALDAQIRVLKVQKAVLRAVARRGRSG